MGVAFQRDHEDYNIALRDTSNKVHKICDFGCKLKKKYYLPLLSIPELFFHCSGIIPKNTEIISQLNVQFERVFLEYLR